MSKKPRGHFCRICQQHKSNEKFSGRGHAAHICKACAKRGNKPPEIKDEPPIFIDEGYVDIEDYFFDGADYITDDHFMLKEQPAPKKKKRKPDKAKQLRAEQKKTAKAFLIKLLSSGEVSAEIIFESASKAKIPTQALRRAKGSLGIKSIPSEGGSVWRLPLHNKQPESDTDSKT